MSHSETRQVPDEFRRGGEVADPDRREAKRRGQHEQRLDVEPAELDDARRHEDEQNASQLPVTTGRGRVVRRVQRQQLAEMFPREEHRRRRRRLVFRGRHWRSHVGQDEHEVAQRGEHDAEQSDESPRVAERADRVPHRDVGDDVRESVGGLDDHDAPRPTARVRDAGNVRERRHQRRDDAAAKAVAERRDYQIAGMQAEVDDRKSEQEAGGGADERRQQRQLASRGVAVAAEQNHHEKRRNLPEHTRVQRPPAAESRASQPTAVSTRIQNWRTGGCKIIM